MKKTKEGYVWVVRVRSTDVVYVYDKGPKAWVNAQRLALSYDEIDYIHTTSLENFISSGNAWIITREGKNVSIERTRLNPDFGGE